jgi:hypothetical protein
MADVETPPDYLSLDEKALLAQCDVIAHRTAGPGGQHRNKVSSSIRLVHRPTGIVANAADTRHQHTNKALALDRLRMKLACEHRRAVDLKNLVPPPVVAECLHRPKVPLAGQTQRLQIGRKDHRYVQVVAWLLDVLAAAEGSPADAAALLGTTTSNLVSILQADRHALGAAQQIRRQFGHKPLR